MRVEFPDKLAPMFERRRWRYKSPYGGRGSTKSWTAAAAALVLGIDEPLRIVCGRETQKSIAESVHQLLCDTIVRLNVGDRYQVEKARISGYNGTRITFAGVHRNPAAIKSLEGADIFWGEEAQAIRKKSWEIIIPTLRKEHSEIWATWNPDLDTDDTYQRFIVHPPHDAWVEKVTYRDNPWFPEVLRKEMETLKAADIDAYNHVWEGMCINMLASAIYANEIRSANLEGRIRLVPYDRAKPVDCFWDLGYGDMTAIWMVQSFPMEYRIIDYMEGSGRSIQHWLSELQQRGYVFGCDYIPWDVGMHAALMGGGRSVEQLMLAAGRKVRMVPKIPVAVGINAARTLFPQCWFDEDRTKAGVRALSHYRYGTVQTLDHVTREPLHDWASHGADAFRSFAVAIREPQRQAETKRREQRVQVSTWS
jgi:phage terminase large subunit